MLHKNGKGLLGGGAYLADDPRLLQSVIEDLEALHKKIIAFEKKTITRTHKVHRTHEMSARNLLHYVALRQNDIRQLQGNLALLGLSSLGRSESHVLANMNAVLKLLHKALNLPWQIPDEHKKTITQQDGIAALESHTESLLGTRPAQRQVRIMVTLPSEAAEDYQLVHELVRGGMNCARINCAHDGPDKWRCMIKHITRAQRELGKPCRILMDLAGPKLRTGELQPGPEVLKWRPKRNIVGQVTNPARVLLKPEGSTTPPPEKALFLYVTPEWLQNLKVDDLLALVDLRGKPRNAKVIAKEGDSYWIESDQTAYIGNGTQIKREEDGSIGIVSGLLPVNEPLRLQYSDLLIITASPEPGRNAVYNESGQKIAPARIPCTLPAILADVKVGERVWLDDGKIGGVIEAANAEEITVRIVHSKPGGSTLLADKGINLPDSNLRISGLTETDIETLPFIAEHADIAALSFLRSPEDVNELQKHLVRIRAKNLGIILKIETRKALENLPAILLAAMKSFPIGVMIARGDLAVEIGYEQLAEAQEEILSMCEASHLPVIWATQVLENLTKQGLPSRAEITDAAMSVRAECVMLNKGPYIQESLRVLDRILQRMAAHQHKKITLLGPLNITSIEESP